jgi:chromosome condensin MukBEF ATPase and DNA-binding subunit MukB
MTTYVIDDLEVIKKITGRDIYKKIVLHVDSQKKEAKYESDYTLFELTERLDYDMVVSIMNNIK